MQDRRRLLDEKLKNVLGSDHVYFQPPESVKLIYPCIVYERLGIPIRNADNTTYLGRVRYRITAIGYDPDLPYHKALCEEFENYLSYDRHFGSDSLNHDVYTLFF